MALIKKIQVQEEKTELLERMEQMAELRCKNDFLSYQRKRRERRKKQTR